MDTKLKNEKF